MSSKVNMGFEVQQVELELSQILPVKMVPKSTKKTKKFKQIAMSVREVGLVEPLVVYPQKRAKGRYMLLDGHLRLEVLKDAGVDVAQCLISKDDESFTYNKRISRLATIQEHYMIIEAIERGVSQERIAQSLGVNIARIRQKRNLLDGVCDEAIDVLKDRHFPDGTMNVMKNVLPLRQVEIAELMVAANNYSISYAKALLMATPREQLRDPEKQKPIRGISEEERERMEHEIENLRRDMKAVEEDYGANVVRLVVANGYVARLLHNDHVASYLGRYHPELQNQLMRISEALADEGSGPSKPLS